MAKDLVDAFHEEADLSDAFNNEKDSLSPEQPAEGDHYGMLGSAARGGVEGLTMGFGDEILGGVYAAGHKLIGEQGSLGELYEKYRDQERAANKQAEEDNPMSYLGGNLAGGIGGFALVPELGIGKAVAGGLKTAGMGAEGLGAVLTRMGVTGVDKLSAEALAKVVADTGVKNVAELGASRLAKGAVQKEIFQELGKQALIGGAEMGAMGAVMGAGESEQNVASKGFAGDVIKGATYGALGGAAMGTATSVAAPVIKAGMESLGGLETKPFLRQTVTAFKDAEAGVLPVMKEATRDVSNIAESNAVTEMVGRMNAIEDNAGKQMQKTLVDAGEKGITIDPKEALDTINQFKALDNNMMVKDAHYKELIKQGNEILANNKLSPHRAWEIAHTLESVANRNKSSILGLPEIANNFSGNIRNILKEQVPGFEEASTKFYDIRNGIRDFLGAKNIPQQFKNTRVSNSLYPDAESYKDIEKMLTEMNQSNATTADSAGMARKLVDNVINLQTAYPDTLEKLGYDSIGSFKKDLMHKADRFAINKAILGETAKGGTLSGVADLAIQTASLGASPTPRGVAYAVAQKAAGAKKLVNTAYNVGQKTAEAIGNRLIGHGLTEKAKNAGKSLLDALKNNNSHQRNAALFLIKSSADMNSLVQDLIDEGEGEGHERK